jgi:Flp pilus assembly protein TadD
VDQVTATILALLGLPKGRGLGAPALAGVPEVEPAKDYGPRTTVLPAAADPAAQEALEKLKALGYLGATESAARPAGTESTRTAGSYNNEGLLLVEGGRLDEARAAFEQALKVDSHAASAAQNLSGLLAESDPARADALLLGALKDGLGDGPHLVAAAARAHRKGGDRVRARRLLDGAIAVAPGDPELHVERGSVRIEERDCAGALLDFESARRAAPHLALAHGLAGTAMLCLGRSGEARAAFERSLALDPNQTRLREALARLR